MTLFIAYNTALSTTTAVGPGTSYATGAKVALQLGIPLGGTIQLIEWGWTQDVATATGSLVEVASTATASTMTTAHSTTTVKPLDSNNVNAGASRLTMSTITTGFGNGAITSNTTLRNAAHLYVPQAYVFQWPLGNYPEFGGAAAEYLQIRCNTTATVNALCWMVWQERI